MIILVDQDGVLADFERGFLENWWTKYPNETCVLPNCRRNFEIYKDYREEQRGRVESIYHSPGFFIDLMPIPGALEGFKELVSLGHTVRICTSPLTNYEHCVLEKFQWVEKHLGKEFTKNIMLTKDKTLVRGNVLVDDKPEVTGLARPEWKHILYDAPYNRGVTGKKRLTWANYKQVLGI